MNYDPITKQLLDKYKKEGAELTMGEFLSQEKVPEGLSFEDAFIIYSECQKAEGGLKIFAVNKNGYKLGF